MVYFVYALMYDASRQAPIELLATGQPDDVEIETETIKAIYRYSGYVDLTDNKIYRPVIKKTQTNLRGNMNDIFKNGRFAGIIGERQRG